MLFHGCLPHILQQWSSCKKHENAYLHYDLVSYYSVLTERAMEELVLLLSFVRPRYHARQKGVHQAPRPPAENQFADGMLESVKHVVAIIAIPVLWHVMLAQHY